MYSHKYSHAIRVHGLANVKVVVLEVSNNLLCVCSSTLLESRNSRIVGAVGLHGLLDLLHVGLQVAEVCLLVELCVGEAERVDDVKDGNGTILGILSSLLGGSVRTSVNLDSAQGDVAAVRLEDNVINLLEIEGVRNQLVAGDDVLRE